MCVYTSSLLPSPSSSTCRSECVCACVCVRVFVCVRACVCECVRDVSRSPPIIPNSLSRLHFTNSTSHVAQGQISTKDASKEYHELQKHIYLNVYLNVFTCLPRLTSWSYVCRAGADECKNAGKEYYELNTIYVGLYLCVCHDSCLVYVCVAQVRMSTWMRARRSCTASALKPSFIKCDVTHICTRSESNATRLVCVA